MFAPIRNLTLALSITAALFATTARASVVGEWNFDSLAGGTTVQDQIASNDLTVNNTVGLVASTAGVTGTGFGNAAEFGDTNSDYLEGAADSYAFGSGAFTYTGWVNTNPQGSDGTSLFRMIVENGQHNNGGVNVFVGPSHRSYRGKIGFDIKGTGADNLTVFSDNSIDDGNWHWFAAVSDGSTATLYVDGVLQAASASYGAQTTATPPTGKTFIVGKALDGRVDQLAVHNMALTGSLDANGMLTGGELYDLWQQVPEPTSLVPIAIGLMTIFVSRRR